MKLLQPEQRAAEQEAAYLIAPVVEDERAPVAMFALPGIRVFVKRGPIEACEAVLVLGKVAGHPVENDAEAMAVTLVDEVAEVVWRAEPARWREEPDHLIAPRSGKRMLEHGHELDVREAHFPDVRNHRTGQLAIRERPGAVLGHAPPRSEMDLVY